MARQGRISKEEEAFIQANIGILSHTQIAEKLDRDPDSVQLFIKRKFKIGLSNEEEAIFSLKDRPYYRDLKEQFTDDELEMFSYHWSRIISQFKDDVIPTEEIQVVDLVKLDILMNRSLKLNKEGLEKIRVFEDLLLKARMVDVADQDRDEIFNYEHQIASMKASQDSVGRDYRDLQDKKNKMLKEMKATREQRVKILEDSKQSFSGWLAFLISNPDVTRGYGLDAEKLRLAMEKERVRLSGYHKYEDGMVDNPFLNADTVIARNKAEKEERKVKKVKKEKENEDG